MSELFERIKTYLGFGKEELLDMVISIGIVAFMFYFSKKDEIGLFSSLLIVAISLFFHIAVQKVVALKVGFKTTYKIWWYGLLASAMLMLISRGNLWWIIIPGGISFSLLAGLRLGEFRYGLNYIPMGAIGFAGPIASIILGTIFKNIEIYLLNGPNVLFHSIFLFNIAYAVCSMLPIPPLDGHYMFYASRTWYVFLFALILLYALLVAAGVYSWILAVVLAIIAVIIYYLKFEVPA